MRFTIAVIAILLFATCSPDNPFHELRRLKGTWLVSDGEGGAYEEWQKSRGDSMVGRAFKVNGPDTLVRERLVIRQDGETVWYVVTLKGENNQQPVAFRLSAFNDSSYTFENKEHDFPQRIIYRFINDDSLVATVEGLDSTVRRFFDFYYSRVR
ncbi:MAG TPA: DUF6265 family protein [Chitinophagaceae bacterium]